MPTRSNSHLIEPIGCRIHHGSIGANFKASIPGRVQGRSRPPGRILGPTAPPARSLTGASGVSLAHWIKQAAIDFGEADGLTTSEREELKRLRRENRILREERAILRKAAAFFAQEEMRR